MSRVAGARRTIRSYQSNVEEGFVQPRPPKLTMRLTRPLSLGTHKTKTVRYFFFFFSEKRFEEFEHFGVSIVGALVTPTFPQGRSRWFARTWVRLNTSSYRLTAEITIYTAVGKRKVGLHFLGKLF